MRFQNKNIPENKFFTMVELLVVIAIICVLMTILLPALKKAKEQVNRIACINNMKQVATVVSLYTGDFDGWYPAVCVWDGTQYLYWTITLDDCGYFQPGSTILRKCPSNRGPDLRYDGYYTHYGLNYGVTGYWTSEGRVSQVRKPSQKILLADVYYGKNQDRAQGYITCDHMLRFNAYYGHLDARHNHSVNVFWCDGHASSVKTGVKATWHGCYTEADHPYLYEPFRCDYRNPNGPWPRIGNDSYINVNKY